MKRIVLCGGKTTKVDDEDYEWLSKWKWYVKVSHGRPAVYRNNDRSRGEEGSNLMHHIILGVPEGTTVKHVDRDNLNNQRSNLWTWSMGAMRSALSVKPCECEKVKMRESEKSEESHQSSALSAMRKSEKSEESH